MFSICNACTCAVTMAMALCMMLALATATSLRQAELPTQYARRILDRPRDGDLKFHETTFLASHNSHASLAASANWIEELGANQEDAIIDQLTNDGVRGLLLDVVIDDDYDEPLRLVHGSGFFAQDYGGFRSELEANLIPFLESDNEAIVSFFLQTDGDVMEYLRDAFDFLSVNGTPLKDMTFKYDDELWQDHADWPTLEEIRVSGQRLFMFADKPDLIDTNYGFMYNRHVLQENHWEGIDECAPRFMWSYQYVSLPSNNYWSRLFFMNHFCCGSGPAAKGNTVGNGLIGGGNNGWGILYHRVQECISNNGGYKPNFIALDWVSQSQEAQDLRTI